MSPAPTETKRSDTGLRLIQILGSGGVGGAEAFFERLAPALARAGVTQHLVIRRSPERARRLGAHGLEVSEAGFGRPLDLATGWKLRSIVRAFAPDVVLTWMSRASAACPPGPFVQVGRLGGYYDLKYYRTCRHLIGNTRDIVEYVVKAGWPAGRVHYLPNFVDATSAPPLDRAALDTPAGVPLVLALGRLHPAKGFDVLLQALAQLPDAWLWLAGEGELDRALRALAAELGIAHRVRFLGWRRDVPALLAAADLLVCPSRYEPLGNVVIEAWAHRVPVVAAASAGPKALIEDGRTGLLVPIDEPDALAGAVRRVIEAPEAARQMAEAAHRCYQARYAEQVVVGAYLDLLQRVAGD